MAKLLLKELRLSMHPTGWIFLGLSAMVLIPGYPFYVTFFYTSLAIFFTCLSGRENQDITYTLLLPVKKIDVVRGRMLLAVVLELAQLVLVGAFCILRAQLHMPLNPVGIEPNLAFLGASLAMLGLFNLVFFTGYYRNVVKVGTAFVKASVAMGVYMAVAETLVHVVPFARDVLDTPDPAYMLPKAVVLGAGIGIFIGLTICAYRSAKYHFEIQDL